MIKDNIIFLREFFTDFQATGTFFPSSKWAADALAAPIRHSRGHPLNILEVGPGSGPVTVQLLKYMSDEDTFTICEINPRFMLALKKKLSRNADYLRHKERIFFFEGPVQNLPEDRQYDAIICAIPFLNFEVETVREIFEKFARISNEQTQMTYFEYIGLRSLGLVVSLPERRKRLLEIDQFFKQFFSSREINRTRVWLNVLPINIYKFATAA